jgi:hypothetical protein
MYIIWIVSIVCFEPIFQRGRRKIESRRRLVHVTNEKEAQRIAPNKTLSGQLTFRVLCNMTRTRRSQPALSPDQLILMVGHIIGAGHRPSRIFAPGPR